MPDFRYAKYDVFIYLFKNIWTLNKLLLLLLLSFLTLLLLVYFCVIANKEEILT